MARLFLRVPCVLSGSLLLFLGVLGGCATELTPLDMPDRNVPEPGRAQIEAWRGEAYRADPCQVAHYELQMKLDVPWKGERFDREKYTFTEHSAEHPDWGAYVVRGYVDRAGRVVRYRVKVRRDGNVWYATQVSHYYLLDLGDPESEPEH